MMSRSSIVLGAAVSAATVLASPSVAATVRDRPVQVSGAWTRPTPRGLPTGAVYLTVSNPGVRPDQLVGASTPVAAAMTLHRSTVSRGVVSMTPVAMLTIPPGGAVTLAPGGYHFMLTGLKSGLTAGRAFPASLRFAHAGVVRIQVTVRSGAPEPAMAGMKMP